MPIRTPLLFRALLIALLNTTSLGLSAALPSTPPPALASNHALVLDENGEVLLSKRPDIPTSIASITKLMNAMVVLDAKLPKEELLEIGKEDLDTLKNTHSRLLPGARLSRDTMLKLALSSSENRAAHTLSRHYPGGTEAFVKAMNQKARQIGMINTRFLDPTGLNPGNVSTAEDLAKMVKAAYEYPAIREASTLREMEVQPFPNKKPLQFKTTNRLLRSNNEDWTVLLSKTGFINEAGRCLVMRASTAGREMTIVLLDAVGKLTPYGDSNRIRNWLLGKRQSALPKTNKAADTRLHLKI